jgi:hypothetical protein
MLVDKQFGIVLRLKDDGFAAISFGPGNDFF